MKEAANWGGLYRRGLPFIFVSGYGPRGRPEAFRARPALPKPLLISKLGETIDAILATASEASSPPDTPNFQ
jgi:hypothetical protein